MVGIRVAKQMKSANTKQQESSQALARSPRTRAKYHPNFIPIPNPNSRAQLDKTRQLTDDDNENE